MMDEIEIKNEFDSNNLLKQCHTCLSVGRKLKAIGNNMEIFKKILPVSQYQMKMDSGLLICWECESLLGRVIQFQKRVYKANQLLNSGQNFVHGTLSKLTSTVINDTHPHTIYVTKANTQKEKMELSNYKNSSDDNFEDDLISVDIKIEDEKEVRQKDEKVGVEKEKKPKPINRWAQKRAMMNKKPKFKILNSLEDIFRKEQLRNEEMGIKLKSERDSECYKTAKYKCKSCILGFRENKLYLKHYEKQHSEKAGAYVCDICNTRMSNKRHLSAHISKHYYKYTCTLCSYVCYNNSHMKIHARKEHRKTFVCLKCGLRLGCRRDFFKHFKEWHEKFVCDYCGISFKMKYCIKDHIRKQHSPFECKPCNKRFARYNGLWLHNKTRHSTPTSAAYCVECDKEYVDIYRYKWHLSNSARHKPKVKIRVPCPSCDKIFTKKIYMKDHYNLVHLKNYKYRCEECDKNFIRNADLVKHKRRVHEGILPPKNKICYMCGRGFTTNKILTNHLRTHTGERPFACSCGARFAQSAALAAHSRAVHASKEQNRPSE